MFDTYIGFQYTDIMLNFTNQRPPAEPGPFQGPSSYPQLVVADWGPQWRTDLMPYGGLKESGMGKEGPRYAVQEMTETKMVVMHLES